MAGQPVADEPEPGGVELVERPELAGRVPPLLGHGGESRDFGRIDAGGGGHAKLRGGGACFAVAKASMYWPARVPATADPALPPPCRPQVVEKWPESS